MLTVYAAKNSLITNYVHTTMEYFGFNNVLSNK